MYLNKIMKFKRVLLKLSGEVLAGDKNKFGHDFQVINNFAKSLAEIRNSGIELAIVIGGGNLIRGRDVKTFGLDPVNADYMGMLGTVMNAIALKDSIEKLNVPTDVYSAVGMEPIAELFNRQHVKHSLESGHVVIFGAGTGHPFFSTDSAAALRAAEISADCLIKATKVNGIYDKDPVKFKDAKFLPELTFSDALKLNIEVMDAAAFAICRDNNIPIWVIGVQDENWHSKICDGSVKSGTIVK